MRGGPDIIIEICLKILYFAFATFDLASTSFILIEIMTEAYGNVFTQRELKEAAEKGCTLYLS